MHRLRFHSQALSPVLSALPPVLETPHEIPSSQERDARLLRGALLKEAPLHRGLEFSLGKVLSAAVTNTGSLLRAQIALVLGRALGETEPQALKFACAVEYFHIASLLLDDLPQMDDARERRGQVCLHLLHGENAVLLGALALITRGYALVGESGAGASEKSRNALNGLLESCLGTRGVLNGQAFDLKFSDTLAPKRSSATVALRKTVPLLLLSLLGPALIAGASEEQFMGLRRLGIYWGLAYQGLDDLRDVLENPHTSGKTSEQDTLLGRPSMVRQLGVEGSQRSLARLMELANQSLAKLVSDTPALGVLSDFQGLFKERVQRLVPCVSQSCPPS